MKLPSHNGAIGMARMHSGGRWDLVEKRNQEAVPEEEHEPPEQAEPHCLCCYHNSFDLGELYDTLPGCHKRRTDPDVAS